MRRQHLVRSTIIFLALAAILLTTISFLPGPILRQWVMWAEGLRSSPPDSTPLSPTILAPQGSLPQSVGGLVEQAQYQGGSYYAVGCGFLLRLSSSITIGVTTSHSVGYLSDPANTLEKIAFSLNGHDTLIAEFDTLYGIPGEPRTGDDLTVDYILLWLGQYVDPALALAPDSRGAPQPGERVSLFSGLGDGKGGRRVLEGTVQSVESTAVWVLMDDTLDAGGMSGSPLFSQHTGQVVGMAIAQSPRGDRLMIGFHPIGSIVSRAEAVTNYPKIAQYP